MGLEAVTAGDELRAVGGAPILRGGEGGLHRVFLIGVHDDKRRQDGDVGVADLQGFDQPGIGGGRDRHDAQAGLLFDEGGERLPVGDRHRVQELGRGQGQQNGVALRAKFRPGSGRERWRGGLRGGCGGRGSRGRDGRWEFAGGEEGK